VTVSTWLPGSCFSTRYRSNPKKENPKKSTCALEHRTRRENAKQIGA